MAWDGLGNIYSWGWGGASLKDAYFWTRREKVSSFKLSAQMALLKMSDEPTVLLFIFSFSTVVT